MKKINKTEQINSLVVQEPVLARRKWVKEMDLLRAVSCIGVVVGHSVVYPHNTPLLEIINRLITIVVPLFLFLSAYLAFYASPNGTPRGYVGKKLLHVGLPYVLWVTIYTWLPVLAGISQTPSFLDYLKNLTGEAFHLYFIPIVLQFYLVFALNKYARFRRLLYTPWALVGSLGLMLGVQTLFSGSLRPIFPCFYLTFPTWCFYFVLGAWVARWWEPIHKWLVRPGRTAQLAVLFPVGLYLTWILPHAASFEPLVQVALLLMLPLLLALASRIPKGTWLEPVARHSFGIYLIHRLPFNLFQHLYAGLEPYPFFLTSLILQGGIGYGMTQILSHIPRLGWTVGANFRRENVSKQQQKGKLKPKKHYEVLTVLSDKTEIIRR